MPKHSVILVRCALLWFLVGVGLGLAMLLSRAGYGWPGVWPLRPVHGWIMLSGFMVQLALGVAQWILPRNRNMPAPGPTRTWSALLFLNGGVVLMALSTTTLGVSVHVAGIVILVHGLWPRIQSIDVLRGEI